MSATGEILARARREPLAHDPDQIAHDVAAVVTELQAGRSDVRAIGIACAGFIDRTSSRVLFAPNLAWRDEPLKMRLEAIVDHPVTVENDANAADQIAPARCARVQPVESGQCRFRLAQSDAPLP